MCILTFGHSSFLSCFCKGEFYQLMENIFILCVLLMKLMIGSFTELGDCVIYNGLRIFNIRDICAKWKACYIPEPTKPREYGSQPTCHLQPKNQNHVPNGDQSVTITFTPALFRVHIPKYWIWQVVKLHEADFFIWLNRVIRSVGLQQKFHQLTCYKNTLICKIGTLPSWMQLQAVTRSSHQISSVQSINCIHPVILKITIKS